MKQGTALMSVAAVFLSAGIALADEFDPGLAKPTKPRSMPGVGASDSILVSCGS